MSEGLEGPLVTCEWLRDHLDDDHLVIAEIAQERDQPDYYEGHVPGAHRWYWKDLVWDTHKREFPSPDVLAARLGERGVGDDEHVVLYAVRNQYAIYCYWVMAELCGLDRVHVLDGGKVRWQHLACPISKDEPPPPPPRERAVPAHDRRDDTRIRSHELLARLEEGTAPRLLDVRYTEEYEGRRVKPGTGFDYGAERYGHIPGAISTPYERFLSEDGGFRPVDELRAEFENAGLTPEQADEVVVYCRLGHRASLTWFIASELLEYDHVRLYDGSWTEWGSMVGMPVER